jgi:hypothetical protein
MKRSIRLAAALVLFAPALLAGCPLAMRDDYVLDTVDRGTATPPDDSPDGSMNAPEGSTELPDADASAADAQVCGDAGANRCGVGLCVPCGCNPKTCDKLGANCGPVSDGCGGMLDCGHCKAGQVCGARSPNHCDKTAD